MGSIVILNNTGYGAVVNQIAGDVLGTSLPYFDSRIYHHLSLLGRTDSNGNEITNNSEGSMYADADYGNMAATFAAYPMHSYGKTGYDYYETPGAIEQKILELTDELEALDSNAPDGLKEELREMISEYKKRVQYIKYENTTGAFSNMIAPHSLIHPYAVVKLAGIMGRGVEGDRDNVSYAYDRFNQRKWYEIHGDSTGGYSKNPTTSKIIEWGTEDFQGRTPYSFQDFVFCKHWNVIPNNRLITLRRYAAPVTDNIEFDNYKSKEYSEDDINTLTGLTDPNAPGKTPMGWSPLATAVTYFGEGTGNTLSSLLKFTAKYNWKEVTAKTTPLAVEAEANNEGSNLIKKGLLTSAMQSMSVMTGITRAMDGEFNPAYATSKGLPPDPYNNGPYENRILGPINVIMKTIKRERGLEFTNNGLQIKFTYVSRPIAGVNNKAVLLDLLSNMLVMCYSTGTWFGGMERFRNTPNGVYPFTHSKVMNKLYKGQLIGKDGAIREASSQMWKSGTTVLKDIFSEALSAVSSLFKSAMSGVQSLFNGLAGNSEEAEKQKNEAETQKNNALTGGLFTGVQNMLAAHVLKGSTIPWLKHTGALLTGDPVGEWHLTIGNPLNPIAMIGNLVCKGLDVTWMDELGPDDFPIGFEATVTLDHAMGRDRDAIESMYNRGFGRIYTLPNGFRGVADGETKIDKYTGGVNTPEGRNYYEEDAANVTYFGGGGAWIGKTENGTLVNSNKSYNDLYKALPAYQSMIKSKTDARAYVPRYLLTPYQMAWTL